MSSKKSYSRYFIILQEDEKGHSISTDKQPSGYTKIETKNDKCKVSFYVQNVKKDHSQCYMVIVCNKKDTKKLINLGPLNIDENGRADVSYECHIDNIGGATMGVDKVGGAAIIKFTAGKPSFILSGFSSTEIPDGWKQYNMIEGKKTEESKIVEKKEEIKKEDKKEEKKEVKEVKSEESNIKEKNNMNGDCECKGDNKCTKNKEFDEYEREIEKTKNAMNKEEFPKGSVGEFFQVVLEGFEEVKNIAPELKMCKWYKIPIKDLDVMCNISNYNKYTIVYYPMINYYPYIKKSGYYMLGLKCDNDGQLKYLVYAIPGTRDKADQPYGGKSGFVTWIPETIEDGKESEAGYWMMFYDFRNSIIVVPMK